MMKSRGGGSWLWPGRTDGGVPRTVVVMVNRDKLLLLRCTSRDAGSSVLEVSGVRVGELFHGGGFVISVYAAGGF